MKKLILCYTILVILISATISIRFIEKEKEIWSNRLEELTLTANDLQIRLNEYETVGIEVDVTMYHPVTRQTDSTPNILADGTRIRVQKASEYKFIAVSRNLLRRFGGFLDYGDFVLLKGTKGHKDGVYQVRDTMNKRFVNRIDVLESPGKKPYKYANAEIYKLTDTGVADWTNQ
jgi:3D (Asp-Asp-Asp) domain-containing protein|tara:strand:- start:6912 stop:7436 length:525 start_codon:yes stop_codon:yes gene_type:complete